MSLAIDIDRVQEVLIAGQWHTVEWDSTTKSTFLLDSYEYMEGDYCVFGGGQNEAAGIPSTGFAFREVGRGWVYGPLSAIQAVVA
jgi:hypothetical protein